MSAPAGAHGGPWLTGEALLAALRRLDPADRGLQVWLADPLAPDGYVRAAELAIGEDPDPAAGDPYRFLVVTTCDRADRAGPPSRSSKSASEVREREVSSEPIDHVAMVAFDADDVLGAYRGLVADDDAELPERVLAYVREHADRIERPLARRGLEILDDLVDEALTRAAQAPDAEIVDELGGC